MGKTNSISTLALYVHKEYGLKTRVYTADTGGYNPLKPLQERGILDVMSVDLWDHPFLTIEQCSKGFWPEDPSLPNSPLKPMVRNWKPCPLCSEDSGATMHAVVLKCKSCGKPYPPGTVLRIQTDLINGGDSVGAIAFEGLTAFGDLVMESMSKRTAQGEDIGPQAAHTKFEDGSFTNEAGVEKKFMIGSNSPAHFGIAQDHIHGWVKNSKLLPVKQVCWTALEQKAEEGGMKGGGRIYAPSIPGKAASGKCLSWFTDVIHMDLLSKGKDPSGIEQLERKFFLTPHYAPDDPLVPYKAKVSAPAQGLMPKTLEPDFRVFFAELKKAHARTKEALDKELK